MSAPPITDRRPGGRLQKVPEVTVWFWLVKVLCTTVGESLADHVNDTLGLGLTNTTIMFVVALLAVGALQFRLLHYVPGVYWLLVVLVGVVGTLLTDELTVAHRMPPRVGTLLLTALLLVVLGVWYLQERTLSLHTITTVRREAFYWLAVLVTFALGTAAGDWTGELTGWTPGRSVLLPAALLLAVTVARRFGVGPVLCFWTAFVLTRPLGADIGDFLASSTVSGGLGLGTLGTSLLFLGAILVTVVYLAVTGIDRAPDATREVPAPGRY